MAIVPAMEQMIPWADETWSFKLWKNDPMNSILEYLSFRELALQRKKCLTIAQYTLERFVEQTAESCVKGNVSRESLARAELDRASMEHYLRQAKMIDTYINVMMSLGQDWWTRTVDESILPNWMCATQVISKYSVCTASFLDSCKDQCDAWATAMLTQTQGESRDTNSLDFWKRRAMEKVVSRWVDLSDACEKQCKLCMIASSMKS